MINLVKDRKYTRTGPFDEMVAKLKEKQAAN